jgi:hypothetical protein
MRRLISAVAMTAVLVAALAGPAAASKPNQSFSAEWGTSTGSLSSCFIIFCDSNGQVSANVSWAWAGNVKSIKFDFSASGVGSGDATFDASRTITVPSTPNGSTTTTFTWNDVCTLADTGVDFGFTATFYNAKGKQVGSVTQPDVYLDSWCGSV